MHHRRQRAYDRQQRERRWHELPQPAAAQVRVGVMGMGAIGRDAAAMLARFGFAGGRGSAPRAAAPRGGPGKGAPPPRTRGPPPPQHT